MRSPAKVFSAAVIGIKAKLIEVEVDTAVGLSSFSIVGLADKAVKESKERISSAIKNFGASPPNKQNRRVTVNLAPADIPKAGSAYDLAIAIGYLIASEQMSPFSFSDNVLAGELALDGSVRSISGALPIVKEAARHRRKEVLLPRENAKEAALVGAIRIIPVDRLQDAVEYLEQKKTILPQPKTKLEDFLSDVHYPFSIVDVHGQENAKRAPEIAAAGGHNLLMLGSPGVGKTMLAKSMPSILPPMNEEEVIEVTEIYSSCGLNADEPIVVHRPMRAPHHTASPSAIIGGGTNPRAGEISLAHRGVLFMDELPEFRTDVLEALRQPLEDGIITIARAKQSLTLPASFIFLASMNPCPCGFYGDQEKECRCNSGEILRYQKRISGPLLDRIDMQIDVPRIGAEKIIHHTQKNEGELFEIRERVVRARKTQEERLRPFGKRTNAEMSSKEARSLVKMEEDAMDALKKSITKEMLSVRGYYKILKIAQTIADLEQSGVVTLGHVAEALQYRMRSKES